MRILVAALALLTAAVLPAGAAVTRHFSGNSEDVRPKLHGPVLDLAGGSTDVESAIQWMIDKARGCTDCDARVDVVVLRASGADGYNQPILAMNGVDSVESLVITSRIDAQDPSVAETIRRAEVVFFAGGDQCNYTTNFMRTPVEYAVESVYRRGGGIGGTSAGLAIQGEFTFDACNDTVYSADILADPYHPKASFTYDFFNWKFLSDVITDSHFQQRDRMGRTLGFLARQIRDKKTKKALGLAVNEKTSVVVDKTGIATVMGSDAAFFILADKKPDVCEKGKPLTYTGYKIWKRKPGESFNLRNRPKTGFYKVDVKNGVIVGNPYGD